MMCVASVVSTVLWEVNSIFTSVHDPEVSCGKFVAPSKPGHELLNLLPDFVTVTDPLKVSGSIGLGEQYVAEKTRIEIFVPLT